MDCNVLHSRRVGNFLLTSNAERRRYRKSGNAQQKLVSRVLVAKFVNGAGRDIKHLRKPVRRLHSGSPRIRR
jgi:hypothetical protein